MLQIKIKIIIDPAEFLSFLSSLKDIFEIEGNEKKKK